MVTVTLIVTWFAVDDNSMTNVVRIHCKAHVKPIGGRERTMVSTSCSRPCVVNENMFEDFIQDMENSIDQQQTGMNINQSCKRQLSSSSLSLVCRRRSALDFWLLATVTPSSWCVDDAIRIGLLIFGNSESDFWPFGIIQNMLEDFIHKLDNQLSNLMNNSRF